MSAILAAEVDIYSDNKGWTLRKKNGKCRKIPAPAGPRRWGCFHPTRCVFVVVFVSVDLQLHMEVGVSFAATLTTLCSPLFKWQLLSITLNGKQSMAWTRPQSSPSQSVSVCVAPCNTHTQTHTRTNVSRSKSETLFFLKALQWHIFHGIL